ncbi:MAG: threonine synthase [Polyangiaceae bacterium]
MTETLKCVRCEATYDPQKIRYTCDCGSLLSLEHSEGVSAALAATWKERRRERRGLDQSGVWTFRERVLSAPESDIVSHPEGYTRLYERASLGAFAGLSDLWFKHEGENPTGSFKDRGMTVAVTQAKRLGCKIVACASTGNTSASLAAYAAQAGLTAVVFLPDGKVTSGKLAQTLAYGAHCLAVRGDFDKALKLVREASDKSGAYLVNSINPFRIEGQKTIIWELLADLEWKAPDWIVVPAGNLGNTSAFGKALREAHAWGLIDKLPRVAAIQASGANPFFQSFTGGFKEQKKVTAETVATAIRIGDPVNHARATETITHTRGVVEEVTDDELMHAKSLIDQSGVGCEPASACTLAGLRKLVQKGIVSPSERAVCILTGHVLKDPDVLTSDKYGKGNRARIYTIDATSEEVAKRLGELSKLG